jgi:hypothetical protein
VVVTGGFSGFDRCGINQGRVNSTFNTSSPQPRDSKLTTSNEIVATLFFLFFLGMGLVFMSLIVRDLAAQAQTYAWRKTECDIVSSGATDLGNDYGFQVQYDYEFGGQHYHGWRSTVTNLKTLDYRKVQLLIDQYPVGAKTTCYVNPSDATDAVLQRGSLGLAPFILLPLLFVVIGAGGIYGTWRGGPGMMPRPLRRPANRRSPTFLYLIFLIVGGVAIALVFVRPILNIQRARNWPATPCRVISSRVQSHHGKRTTYSVDILYAYTMENREYRSNQYDFMMQSNGSRSEKEGIVQHYRPGTKVTCYVDPQDPTDAVLEPRFSSSMWVGLVPGVFFVIGVAGLVRVFLGKGRDQAVAVA